MAGLHAHIRRAGLAVFVDLRAMAHSVKARVPISTARRKAEYVLIDNARVPLGFDEMAFLANQLSRVHHARNGMGFTRADSTRVVREVRPVPMPSLEVKIALRREDRSTPYDV
ncbi:MAG TPA: hypothetical protein VM286_03525 [Candidatus Thermoplasmatota archaeon]|nr:hypothetical protein [Candidatus Thermoplasmatota archaeon]